MAHALTGEAMTTNQTIDGVPREWIEEYEALADLTSGDAQKLRALLDAPACKTCGDSGYVVEPFSIRENTVECPTCKPAAQPQGEPWRTEVSQFLTDAMTAAGMVRHGKKDKKFAERLADACVRVRFAWLAEQPAPVAVVLAEAREWLGDGKNSDGLAREHWTPEYAALIDRIDATLRK